MTPYETGEVIMRLASRIGTLTAELEVAEGRLRYLEAQHDKALELLAQAEQHAGQEQLPFQS